MRPSIRKKNRAPYLNLEQVSTGVENWRPDIQFPDLTERRSSLQHLNTSYIKIYEL